MDNKSGISEEALRIPDFKPDINGGQSAIITGS